MKPKEDSLKKRYLIKLLANLMAGGLNVAIFAIVPKALGPALFGQFVYLQDFFTKMIGFLELSSSTAFFTKLSANNNRIDLIQFYLLFSFMLLFVVVLLVTSIDFFNYNNKIFPTIDKEYIYLGLFFVFLTWLSRVFIKISDAYALTFSVESVKIMHRIITFLGLLWFVYYADFNLVDYFYYQIASVFSFILIIGLLFKKKKIFNKGLLTKKINFKQIFYEFRAYCSPLVVYATVGVLTGVFDIWLLQKIAGPKQTGFYGLAFGIIGVSLLFSSAMTSVITREFSKSYAKGDILEIAKLFKRYVPMLYAITTYFVCFVAVQSDVVLYLFAGSEYKDAYWVLVVLAFYPMHQVYGQLSGSVFYATERTKLFTKISMMPMLLGVGISFILIYIFDLGALGLAWKMIMSQFIGIVIQLHYNSIFLRLSSMYFFKHQALIFLIFLSIAFIANFIDYHNNIIVNFIFSGMVYTLLIAVIIYFFPVILSVSKSERDVFILKFIRT
jgi:O-antigen/teichoic acid export membrane protein